MGFDFTNGIGESFGDIESVFFKKNGKSILPEQKMVQATEKIAIADITKTISNATNELSTNKHKNHNGNTIINISKDVLGVDEDKFFALSILEEKRKNQSTVRNKAFIDIDTGVEIIIVDQTELYNGTNLYISKDLETQKTITYPRSMFVGKAKKFVPKDFYIREAERAIEDTIDKHYAYILEIIQTGDYLSETPDGRYLELVLDECFEINGNIKVPDKIQIPVKRMFDLEYKILMLEHVICLDNKIAGLLFNDIWF